MHMIQAPREMEFKYSNKVVSTDPPFFNKVPLFFFRYTAFDLRVRLGEWDVNHDVEFFPYEERDVQTLFVHPEFYAGTLYNDIAVLRLDRPVGSSQAPHISPACLPEPSADFSGARCWTTGWGKDAFGDYGKYQNILKVRNHEVIVATFRTLAYSL